MIQVQQNTGMDELLARVQARVAERFPADLERIREYLPMPSVSATGEWIVGAAAFLLACAGLPEATP
jgi:hypothetical protein